MQRLAKISIFSIIAIILIASIVFWVYFNDENSEENLDEAAKKPRKLHQEKNSKAIAESGAKQQNCYQNKANKEVMTPTGIAETAHKQNLEKASEFLINESKNKKNEDEIPNKYDEDEDKDPRSNKRLDSTLKNNQPNNQFQENFINQIKEITDFIEPISHDLCEDEATRQEKGPGSIIEENIPETNRESSEPSKYEDSPTAMDNFSVKITSETGILSKEPKCNGDTCGYENCSHNNPPPDNIQISLAREQPTQKKYKMKSNHSGNNEFSQSNNTVVQATKNSDLSIKSNVFSFDKVSAPPQQKKLEYNVPFPFSSLIEIIKIFHTKNKSKELRNSNAPLGPSSDSVEVFQKNINKPTLNFPNISADKKIDDISKRSEPTLNRNTDSSISDHNQDRSLNVDTSKDVQGHTSNASHNNGISSDNELPSCSRNSTNEKMKSAHENPKNTSHKNPSVLMPEFQNILKLLSSMNFGKLLAQTNINEPSSGNDREEIQGMENILRKGMNIMKSYETNAHKNRNLSNTSTLNPGESNSVGAESSNQTSDDAPKSTDEPLYYKNIDKPVSQNGIIDCTKLPNVSEDSKKTLSHSKRNESQTKNNFETHDYSDHQNCLKKEKLDEKSRNPNENNPCEFSTESHRVAQNHSKIRDCDSRLANDCDSNPCNIYISIDEYNNKINQADVAYEHPKTDDLSLKNKFDADAKEDDENQLYFIPTNQTFKIAIPSNFDSVVIGIMPEDSKIINFISEAFNKRQSEIDKKKNQREIQGEMNAIYELNDKTGRNHMGVKDLFNIRDSKCPDDPPILEFQESNSESKKNTLSPYNMSHSNTEIKSVCGGQIDEKEEKTLVKENLVIDNGMPFLEKGSHWNKEIGSVTLVDITMNSNQPEEKSTLSHYSDNNNVVNIKKADQKKITSDVYSIDTGKIGCKLDGEVSNELLGHRDFTVFDGKLPKTSSADEDDDYSKVSPIQSHSNTNKNRVIIAKSFMIGNDENSENGFDSAESSEGEILSEIEYSNEEQILHSTTADVIGTSDTEIIFDCTLDASFKNQKFSPKKFCKDEETSNATKLKIQDKSNQGTKLINKSDLHGSENDSTIIENDDSANNPEKNGDFGPSPSNEEKKFFETMSNDNKENNIEKIIPDENDSLPKNSRSQENPSKHHQDGSNGSFAINTLDNKSHINENDPRDVKLNVRTSIIDLENNSDASVHPEEMDFCMETSNASDITRSAFSTDKNGNGTEIIEEEKNSLNENDQEDFHSQRNPIQNPLRLTYDVDFKIYNQVKISSDYQTPLKCSKDNVFESGRDSKSKSSPNSHLIEPIVEEIETSNDEEDNSSFDSSSDAIQQTVNIMKVQDSENFSNVITIEDGSSQDNSDLESTEKDQVNFFIQ